MVNLNYFKQRENEDWLIGYDSNQLYYFTEELINQLIHDSKKGSPPKILLSESNPLNFIGCFFAAVAAECHIFLCNPNWKQQEWQQVFNLVKPDFIWGNFPENIIHNKEHKVDSSLIIHPSSLIMIPTGGTSGKIRFAMHSWETLTASVTGFYRYFDEKAVNSFCVLPLYHVSGLMQLLRSFITGGQLLNLPYKALKKGEIPQINPNIFLSL